jgi:hypothetical protein
VSARVPAGPALPLAAFAGTYHDAAYGTITLCAPSSTSAHCQDFLAAFAPFPLLGGARAVLYAAWQRADISHVRLVALPHSESPHTFALRTTDLFPRGFGRDGSAFETDALGAFDAQPGEGRWEFDVDERGRVRGAGWFGVAGPGIVSARERTAGSLEERCDVWMAKVE